VWEKKHLKFDPREMGCEAVDWIHVAQDKDQRRGTVNTVTKILIPSKTGYFLISWATLGLSWLCTTRLIHVIWHVLFKVSVLTLLFTPIVAVMLDSGEIWWNGRRRKCNWQRSSVYKTFHFKLLIVQLWHMCCVSIKIMSSKIVVFWTVTPCSHFFSPVCVIYSVCFFLSNAAF
jgi:hypothetical protein